MRHHHHLPAWPTGPDLGLFHDDSLETHTDEHRRYSISEEPCVDGECSGRRYDETMEPA